MKNLLKEKLIPIIGLSILVVVLIVSTVLLLVKNVGKTILQIESQKVIPGNEISIPITIDKNHGFFNGQIILEYDSGALEFISCENGEVFDECTAYRPNGEDSIIIVVEQTAKLENTEVDGVVAMLNFKVRESAKKGTYPISFYLPETVEEGTCFIKVQDINAEKRTVPKCVNGKIVVE